MKTGARDPLTVPAAGHESRAAGEAPRRLAAVQPAENFLAAVGAVFRKDLLSELRTRHALNALLVFALTTLLLVSLTVATRGLGLTRMPGQEAGQTHTRALLLAALLWIILFFSGMSGLARAFVKEEDAGTARALRFAAPPLAVFFGKLLFNAALQLAVAVVVAPLFVLLLQPEIAQPALLVAYALAGNVALAAATTILGAIVSRAASPASLFAALSFPILLPVLVLAVNGTAAALVDGLPAGWTLAMARNQLLGLVSYVVMLVVLSAWLFEHVWQD